MNMSQLSEMHSLVIIPHRWPIYHSHLPFSGIQHLWDANVVHRNISFGNILLSKETDCSDFFREAASQLAESIQPSNLITFCQRPCRGCIGGLLHDLDMAASRCERQTVLQISGENIQDDMEREGKEAHYDGPWKAVHTVRAIHPVPS
jgi:hypothetical protein